MADSDGDTSFGQGVAAQLSKMDKKQNALAKAKIQMVLLDVQFLDHANPSPFMMAGSYDNCSYPNLGQARFYVPDQNADTAPKTPFFQTPYYKYINK